MWRNRCRSGRPSSPAWLTFLLGQVISTISNSSSPVICISLRDAEESAYSAITLHCPSKAFSTMPRAYDGIWTLHGQTGGVDTSIATR